MAWRWVEKLAGTKKSRSRRDTKKRRLAFEQFQHRRLNIEQLERRNLLFISIAGTIVVSNLTCAEEGSNVPVRGIQVHAWIGDNPIYSSTALNGTGPGGICADAYTDNLGQYCMLLDPNSTVTLSPGQAIHIVFIAQSNASSTSRYQVIQPSPGIGTTYATDPTLVYTYQFDDHSASGGSMFEDLSHDLTLAAPPVDGAGNPKGALNGPQKAALAFAAFSIAETSYDFATTVMHATLAPMISIVIPPLPGDITSASGSALILLENNVFEAPDAIGHEFGHLVSASGDFEAAENVENIHHAQSNQRTLPPTTPPDPKTGEAGVPIGNVMSSDLGVAWNEGFADYFAVACKTAISTAGLNIPHMETDPANPIFYIGALGNMSDSFSAKLTPGWGEDNEISVMRILWNYSHENGATDAKLYQDLTVLDIFQNMATLNDFWDVMKGKANSEIAKAGTIFQKAGVSPVANSYSWVSTTKAPFFTFQIPRLHVADDVPMSLYSYINLLTFSTITISVFDTDKNGNLNTQLWSVTANVTMSGGNYIITPVNAGEGKFAYLGSSGQYAQFTYTVTQADFNQFRAKPGTGVNVRYFVVSGGSTTTGANSVQTGPYWSAPTKFGVRAVAGNGNPNWPSSPPSTLAATEGSSATGVIATFTDPDWPGTPDDYSASINWGNGSVTTVTGTPSSYGKIVYHDPNDPSAGFDVIGTETYAEAGPFPVRTTIEVDGTSIGIMDCRVTVQDAALTVTMNPSLSSGFYDNVFTGGEVATFTDADPDTHMDLSDYAATINWGDGTITAGLITDGTSGQFVVSDNTDHTYLSTGNFDVIVWVYDEDGACDHKDQTVTVNDVVYGGPATSGAVLTPETGLQAAAENIEFTRTLATFTYDAGYAGPIAALLTWESSDGTPHISTATVAYGGGTGTVYGDYTYQQPGSKTIEVQLFDVGGEADSANVSLQVDDAALTLTSVAVSLDGLDAGDMVQVAHLTDADPAGVSSDYSATTDLGSGSQAAQYEIVPAAAGGFDVYACMDSAASGTESSGENSELLFQAVDVGTAGNVQVDFQVGDGITEGNETVQYDPNAGTLTFQISPQTTANDIIAALQNNPVASAAFTASLDTSSDPTNDGSGIVQPQEIELTGGQAGTYAGSSQQITVTVNDHDGATASVADDELALDGGSTDTFAGLPTGSDLTISNGTELDLGGNNINLGTGSVTLSDGSISNGTITSDSTFALQNGSIAANLAGSGSVIASGDGVVDLTGDNTYTGGTSIQDTATLAIGCDQALGNPDGAVTFSGAGTLQALGDLTLSNTRVVTTPADPSLAATIDTNGFDVGMPHGISGQGGLVKMGDGTLDLSGVNNSGLLGDLTVTGGFVAASAPSNLGSGALIFDGGGVQATGNLTIPSGKEIDVCAGGATFDTNSFTFEIDATIGSSNPGGAAGGITVMDSSTNGGGVLLLTGDNIFQGGTTIGGGTLATGADAALGDGGPLTFTGQGTLKATGDLTLASTRAIVTPDDPTLAAVIDSNGHSVTIPGVVSGQGGLTASDSSGDGGALTLSGQNTFTGVTIIDTATETLVLGDEDALEGSTFDTSGPGTLSWGGLSSATFGGLQGSNDFSLPTGYCLSVGGNGFSTTLSGSLCGGGSLTENGPGELVLATDSSGFTGSVTIVGGIVEAAIPAAMPGNVSAECGGTLAVGLDGPGGWQSSQVDTILSSGDFAAGASLGLDTGIDTFQFDGSAIGSSLGLAVLGTGTLDLTGTNTYSAGTAILGATLQIASASNLGASGGQITIDGGTLQATSGFDLSAPIVLGQGGGTIDVNGCDVELDGKISGSGALTAIDSSGGGTLDLTDSDNGYSGGTAIVSATVLIGSDSCLGNVSSTITLDGGTLRATGDLDLSAPIVLNPGGCTIDSNGNPVSLAGVVSGQGGLTAVDGSGNGGTLTLSGQNTFTGVTIIDTATETLVLGNEDALQGSTFDTSGPGTLSWGGLSSATFGGLQGSKDFSLPTGYALSVGGNGFSTTLSGSLCGGGSLTENGPGELVLATDSSGFTGNVTIVGGIVEAAIPAALPGNVSVQSGGTLAVGVAGVDPSTASSEIASLLTSGDFAAASNLGIDVGSGTFEYDGIIVDPAQNSPLGLVVLGSGTLFLTGSNTYSAGTMIIGATVNFSSLGNLGTGGITFDGGTLQYATGFTGSTDISGPGVTINSGGATIDTNGKTVTFASSIGNGGSGGLTVIDSSASGGTLIVSAAIDYAGGTAIVGATLQAGASSGLGASGAPITLDGGTLQASGDLDLSAPIVLNPGGGTIDTNGNLVELDGQVSGPGGLTAVDSSGAGGTLIVTGENTYSGGTTIGSGTLNLSSLGNLGSGWITFDGGTLQYATNLTSPAPDISGLGVTIDAGGATVDTNGNSVTFAYSIGGDGALTLVDSSGGSGMLTLAGSNSSLSSLTVNRGTVAATGHDNQFGSLTMNSGALTINGHNNQFGMATVNGTAALDGSNNQFGTTTINGGGILNVGGAGNDVGICGLYTAVDIESGGQLNLGGTGTSTNFIDVYGGSVTLETGTLCVAGGLVIACGTLDLNGNDLTVNLLIGEGGTISDGGTLTVETGNNLCYDSGNIQAVCLHVTGDGNFTLDDGTSTFSGGIVVYSGSTLSVGSSGSNESLYNDATLTNDGTLIIQGAALWNGGPVDNHGSLSIIDSGYLSIDSGSTLTNFADGTLSINNGCWFSGNVTNDGVMTISDPDYYSGDLNNQWEVFFDGSGSQTFSADISGSGSVTVSGGTLDLGGNSIFVGTVNVTSGGIVDGSITALTLALDNATIGANLAGGTATISGTVSLSGMDSEAITINSGATLAIAAGTTLITSGAITDNGSVANSGILTNHGEITVEPGGLLDNTATIVNGGAVYTDSNGELYGKLSNEGMFTNDGLLVTTWLDNSGTIDNTSGTWIHTGPVLGSGTITPITATASCVGSLTLNSLYTVTGDITIDGANAEYRSMEVADGGTLTVTGNLSVDNLTIDLGGALLIDAGGTLTNNGALTSYGTFTSYGVLNNSAGASLYNHGPMSNWAEINNYGYLENDATSSICYPAGIDTPSEGGLNNEGGAVVNNGDMCLQGPTHNWDGGTFTDNDTLVLFAGTFTNDGSGGGATFNENGYCELVYTSVLDNIDGGAINVGSSGSLVDRTVVYNDVNSSTGYAPSTISIGGYFENDGLVENNGTFTIANSLWATDGSMPLGNMVVNGTFVVADNSPTVDTYSGNLSGTGDLIKVDSGTLILTGHNTVGLVAIYGGTLQLGSATAIDMPTGTVDIGDGATLDLNGYDLTIGNINCGNSCYSSTSGCITNSSPTSASILTFTNGPSELWFCSITDGPYQTVSVVVGSTTVTATTPVSVMNIGADWTYTGGTTINAGATLAVGYGGYGEASLQGNIVDHALLEYLEPAAEAFNNTITDNGNGDGTVYNWGDYQLTLHNLATDLVLAGNIAY